MFLSKWEKGISVPDAELFMQLAEVSDVTVSDLLGKKIEITEGQNEKDILASNIVLLILFISAIYDSW